MTCIIHYEGEKKYGELVQLTETTSKRVLLAKGFHESSDDGHTLQCKTIPSDDLRKYMCHKVPCYKKFVRITENVEGLKSPNLPKPDMMIKSPASSTRSKKKLFEPQVLSTTKKKLHKQPVTPQPSYKLRSAVPVSTSSSRNKYVFGEECLVCNKYELRYKNKDREEVREYPMLLTFDAPLEKIK